MRGAVGMVLMTALCGCAAAYQYEVSLPKGAKRPAPNRLPPQYITLGVDSIRVTLACKNYVMVEWRSYPAQIDKRWRRDSTFTQVPFFVGIELPEGARPVEVRPAEFRIVTASGDSLSPLAYLGPGEPSCDEWMCSCFAHEKRPKGFDPLVTCLDCLPRAELDSKATRISPSIPIHASRATCLVLLYPRFEGYDFTFLPFGLGRAGQRLEAPPFDFTLGEWQGHGSVP